MRLLRIFLYLTGGSLALLIGMTIIGWLLYNYLIERQERFEVPLV